MKYKVSTYAKIHGVTMRTVWNWINKGELEIERTSTECKLNGIEVVLREESYTSKCSFIDNEPIKKHDSYAGRRVKRGLFRSENGTFINADLNGALNILRKEVGEFNYNPIEVCSSPKKLRIGLS